MFFEQVPHGHCLIVERFGKPTRVCASGLRFFIPFLDSAKNVSSIWGVETNKEGIFIELTEQIVDTRPRGYYTSDNVQVNIDCMYRWRITDPIAAVYEVDHLHETVREIVLAEIRAFVGAHELNYILRSRSEISEHVVTAVSASLKKCGVQLVGADIQDVALDEMTRNTMRQQLEASRKGEAKRIDAEGVAAAERVRAEGDAVALERTAAAERKAEISRAEGESMATKLRADGEKAYLDVLVEALGRKGAAKVFMAQRAADSYTQIAGGDAQKVYMQNALMPTLDMIGNKTEK
jgi:regulator of protease activity HflC (stomatin/prohibitin superfamily)